MLYPIRANMDHDGKKSEFCLISKSAFEVQFTLTNVHYVLLNSMRHVMLEEIESLAFHTFRFGENHTVLKHEQIMHRLQMIPMCSDNVKDICWTKDCDCELQLCSKCSIEFRLEKTNVLDTIVDVTTEDLQQINTNFHVKPLFQGADAFTIVSLAKGHSLRMTLYLQKGIGREHGKWVSVTTMKFQGVPLLDAEIFHGLDISHQKQIVDTCPKKVFSIHQNQLDIEDLLSCTACDECLRIANMPPQQEQQPYKKVKTLDFPRNVLLSETDFLVKVQTDGRVCIDDLFEQTFAILKNKLQHLFLRN